MDEEDGKTGARARQSGQLNAPEGVPAQSLCHRLNSVPHSIFPSKIAHCHQRNITNPTPFSGADLLRASGPLQVEEKHYENVPGK
jgi:hypothetical protein